MTPERWRHIESLFHEALDRPSAHRAAFLEEACAGDDALRAHVESLLAADENPAALFDAAPDLLAHEPPAGTPAAAQSIGPYRLLEEIGRGGMGAVYHAERADGEFKKRVALKLVKRGMDTDDILRRFRHERQILAALEHPNIARLYDGGATDDGRSYLVMEYVDGLPIDRYCDAGRLNVSERLALFIQVCVAVHHAHQNLVIHRDLKPSNILVTDDGDVKLLDFGIAKLMEDPGDGETKLRTRTGMRLLTPEYASPEQLAGMPVTTASDVYGLGVVLYELLCGRRPYATSGSREGPTEDLRLLPPSTAATRPIESGHGDGADSRVHPEDVSACRRTTVDGLKRRLRGDLDTIVLKAMQPAPSRRYASAEAFLADVKRHLAGQAVEARRDSLAYRAGKFVHRHRLGVSLAAAFLALLVSATVAISVLQVRASRERDTAEAVAQFLEGLFEASDPYARTEQRLDTLRALDLVELGRQRLGNLDEQPLVQARLADILGNVYRGVGAHDSAVVMHRKALEIRRTHRGSTWRETVATLHNLASNYIRYGQFDEATPLLEEALSLVPLGEVGARGNLLQPLANVHRATGDFDLAHTYLEESIEIQRSVEPSDAPTLDLASRLADMSLLLREMEEYVAAERWIREALEIWESVGRDHPEKASHLISLGAVLQNTGRLDEAEAAFREALAIETRILGADHPVISMTLTHLAELAREKKDFATGVELYREALRRISSADPENTGVAIVSGLLANVLRENGDYEEAETTYLRSIAHMKRVFPGTHVRIGRSYVGLGLNYQSMKAFTKAEAALLEAERILGSDGNPGVERAYAALVSLYEEWNRPADAARYEAKLE